MATAVGGVLVVLAGCARVGPTPPPDIEHPVRISSVGWGVGVEEIERAHVESASASEPDGDVWEGLVGSEVGEAFGVGGLGLVGVGRVGHGAALIDGHLVLTDAEGNLLEKPPIPE